MIYTSFLTIQTVFLMIYFFFFLQFTGSATSLTILFLGTSVLLIYWIMSAQAVFQLLLHIHRIYWWSRSHNPAWGGTMQTFFLCLWYKQVRFRVMLLYSANTGHHGTYWLYKLLYTVKKVTFDSKLMHQYLQLGQFGLNAFRLEDARYPEHMEYLPSGWLL